MGDLAIVLTPEELEDINAITRNLGSGVFAGLKVGSGPIGPNK